MGQKGCKGPYIPDPPSPPQPRQLKENEPSSSRSQTTKNNSLKLTKSNSNPPLLTNKDDEGDTLPVSLSQQFELELLREVYAKFKDEPSSSRSISNPSLVTIEDLKVDTLDVSLSQQFNLELLSEMYTKFKREHDMNNKITSTITNFVSSLIETVTSDDKILQIISKFSKMITTSDDTYYMAFSLASERSTMRFASCTEIHSTIDHRIKVHLLLFLRLHRMLVMFFEDGNDEKAQEIINFVALSHLIMRVAHEYFRVLSVRVIKCMLQVKLIEAEQLPKVVYYFETVNKLIFTAMGKYKQQQSSKFLCKSDFDKPSRNNYRELLKFKALSLSMRNGLSKQITMLNKLEEMETSKEGSDADKCRIIRFLKKEFKYKNKPNVLHD